MLSRKNLDSTKGAFTLAETLIVIAIIGVISVLTLPNVMGNYKKKTYIAQLQKLYNQLSQATQALMVAESYDTFEETSAVTDPEAFLKKYFKTTKVCSTTKDDEGKKVTLTTDCLASSYKDLGGRAINNTTMDNGKWTCAILNTGATICLGRFDNTSSHGQNRGLSLEIDTNGKNGPNVAGRDYFAQLKLSAEDGSVIESGAAQQVGSKYCTAEGNSEGADQTREGSNCFLKILEDGWQMNY